MQKKIVPPRTEVISTPVVDGKASFFTRAMSSTSFVIGATLLLIIVCFVFVVPLLTNIDPYTPDPYKRLQPPFGEYLFGTDTSGRDVFSRIITGAKTSLMLGVIVSVLTSVLGSAIGILSSYFSILDHILMRISDALMAIPGILLAIALAAVLGPTTQNLIIALTIVFIPNVARIVRSKAFAVKNEIFVDAAKVEGAGAFQIMYKHIFPNTLSVLAVQATFIFADSIITEAALSFLGAGIPAPEPSWGNILADGKQVILQSPHMIIITSMFVILTVISLNLIGDGLREIVDNRSTTKRKSKKVGRKQA